jgi:hypothetical protein
VVDSAGCEGETENALQSPRLDLTASLYRYPRISEHFVAVELMVTASQTFWGARYEPTMKMHSVGAANSSYEFFV